MVLDFNLQTEVSISTDGKKKHACHPEIFYAGRLIIIGESFCRLVEEY